jgi:hypothetical protein
MRRLSFAILLVAGLAACSDSGQPLSPPAVPRAAATTETTTEVQPIASFDFIPCANGGAGEIVYLDGTFLTVFHYTQAASGVTSVTLHQNAQGITATGLTTGDTWHGSGGFTDSSVTVGPGVIAHSSGWSQLVGVGPVSNLTVHSVSQVTINANGDATADVDIISVTCN